MNLVALRCDGQHRNAVMVVTSSVDADLEVVLIIVTVNETRHIIA